MAKSASKSKQNYSTLYKSTSRWQSNRKAKLLKQLKLQPNNEQVKDALNNIKYRRRTPTNSEWSHTDIRAAKLFKLFTGRADKDLFSSNPKVQASALQRPSTRTYSKLPQGKVNFTLGARAHDALGRLVWG